MKMKMKGPGKGGDKTAKRLQKDIKKVRRKGTSSSTKFGRENTRESKTGGKYTERTEFVRTGAKAGGIDSKETIKKGMEMYVPRDVRTGEKGERTLREGKPKSTPGSQQAALDKARENKQETTTYKGRLLAAGKKYNAPDMTSSIKTKPVELMKVKKTTSYTPPATKEITSRSAKSKKGQQPKAKVVNTRNVITSPTGLKKGQKKKAQKAMRMRMK